MAHKNFSASKTLAMPLLVVCASLGFACDIDKTQEGKSPEIEVTEGQMPKYDVDGPDVDINTKTKEVEVPDVDINTEKKQVEVPNVDVDMPGDDGE